MKDLFEELTALSIDELVELTNGQATPSPDAAFVPAGERVPALEDVVVERPVASRAQERLWFMDRLAPGNPFYNIPFALRLTGALNRKLFSAAWESVLDRHASLRSRFYEQENGTPGVDYIPADRIQLAVLGEEAADRLPQWLEREAKVGFNLEQGPLIRGMLIPEGTDSHLFLFTVHHIVFDGWSIRIFLDDLFAAYTAGLSQSAPEWAPLAVSYEQYAEWHRKVVAQMAEGESAWWRERFANLPDLELPTDYPRPESQSFCGALHECMLPETTVEGVNRLAREENTTPFVVWLAVYALVVSRRSGQDDFAVGSSFAARNHPSLEPLVGFFVENLAVRIRSGQDLSFRNFVAQTAAVVLDAIEHSRLPFQMIADALGRKRDLSRNPVYQTAFTYQSMPESEALSGGLTCDSLAVPLHSTHMDLEVLAWPRQDGLYCHFMYASDLFSAETIAAVADEFITLSAAAAAAPDSPLNTVGLVEEPSLCIGPSRSFSTQSPYSLFVACCRNAPDSTAVVQVESEGGRERKTRMELLAMADAIAAKLSAVGLGRGDAVGLHMPQGAELMASILAVWRLGGVWVPLLPKSPPSVMGWILRDAGACHVITERGLWKEKQRQARSMGEACLDEISTIFVDDTSGREAGPVLGHPAGKTSPLKEGLPAEMVQDDIACILYTSGSTGSPKGVEITHGALANRLQWMWELFPWQVGEVACQKTSPAFVDFLWESLGPLLAGIPLVIVQSGQVADLSWFLGVLEKERVTRLVLVPSLLANMLAVDGGLGGRLPLLRHLTSSGESLPPSLASAVFETLPTVRLLNIYGSTEVTADAVWHEVEPESCSGNMSIGRPINNVSAVVVDEAGAVLPRGAVGELLLGGACLALGYRNVETAFRAAFMTRDLFFPRQGAHKPDICASGRWFATGDLVRMDETGRLVLLGRKDRQLKVRGVRVEPEEVQTVLERHPMVREARVVGVKARKAKGTSASIQEDARLVAYLVPAHACEQEREQGRAACLRQWENLYDSMYSAVRKQGDILDNYFIWQSSYTGSAIPQEEMREWLRLSLEGIRRLKLNRVLEVGCGQGFILMPLIHECARYVGVDFSSEALGCLRQILHEKGREFEAVAELVQAEATQLPEYASGSFDGAIYNSIVQYFPDIGYLLRSLEQALPMLERKGRIFCGDIRNHDSLETFHTAVQFYTCGDDVSVRRFWDNVTAATRMESELLVAPAFWHKLGWHSERFVHAEVRPKTGQSDNEVFQFRYDVSLYLDSLPGEPFAGRVIEWGRDNGPVSLATLDELLASSDVRHAARHKGIAVVGIPDARVSRFRLLRTLCADLAVMEPGISLGEIKLRVDDRLEASPAELGLSAHVIVEEARKHGLVADIFLEPRDGMSLNVLFVHEDVGPLAFRAPSLENGKEVESPAEKEWFSRFANSTSRRREEADIRSQVREFLEASLPAHSVPDVVMTLEQWPRTPSGKIDWMRLPSPNLRMFTGSAGMQRAGCATEEMLADMWKMIIGIDDVSVHDVFFEIGGTSLLLAQVHQMLQGRLQRKIPLATLFQNPTISSLAAWLASEAGEASPACLSPRSTSGALRAQKRKRLAQKRRA